MMAIAAMLEHTGLYPLDALREAAALRPAFAAQNLAAIAAGVELLARG